jgi:hypothetical protein
MSNLTLPVLVDYFGAENMSNSENVSIILGIYKGLQSLGISKEAVETAFLENKLDDLIHQSYKKYTVSDYYRMFCRKNIKIGRTNPLQNIEDRYQLDEEREMLEEAEDDAILEEAYSKYGKAWVEEQCRVQGENIEKIMILAHEIVRNPAEKFYDCVYDRYGAGLAENYFLVGKEVPVITEEEISLWANYARYY